MPQIYMIITSHARDVLMSKIFLLEPELILAVEKGFGLEGLNDVASTVPAPVLHTNGETEIQIEIRYTAGEDEYGRGKPFDPSLEEQKRLAEQIRRVFFNFFVNHGLERLSLSVWCKPHYHSFFKAFKQVQSP